MDNKILVLGSSGLLGSVVSSHLRARDLNVFLHSRESDNEYKADLT